MTQGATKVSGWMAGWWSLALVAGMALTNPGDPRNGAPGSDASPMRARYVDDGTEDASVHTTAEDVLKALQKLRPPNEPISPASAAGQSPAERRHLLWPEGSRLVSRPGRLGRDDRWWTLLLLDNQGETPLRLLPNATLEAVVRSAGQAEPREFVASGEMTVSKGENYLLLRTVMRRVDMGKRKRSSMAARRMIARHNRSAGSAESLNPSPSSCLSLAFVTYCKIRARFWVCHYILISGLLWGLGGGLAGRCP